MSIEIVEHYILLSQGIKGTIYSVRVYNRALTEEEIIENFEVDKEKYNID